MNDKASQTPASPKDSAKGAAGTHAGFDMEELKRDMRNAQLLDWLKKNQTSLIAAAVIFVLLIGGAAMWIKKVKSERTAAATMYYQSLAVVKDSDKQKLLNALIARHFGTTYTPLAEMQLAHLDYAHAARHLQAVIDNAKSMPEWVWQARLDLARLRLSEGKAAEAMPLLQHSVGAAYEQLRQYLLAQASSDAADKIKHLQQAQAAESYDNNLRKRIDSELQDLKTQTPPASAN